MGEGPGGMLRLAGHRRLADEQPALCSGLATPPGFVPRGAQRPGRIFLGIFCRVAAEFWDLAAGFSVVAGAAGGRPVHQGETSREEANHITSGRSPLNGTNAKISRRHLWGYGGSLT